MRRPGSPNRGRLLARSLAVGVVAATAAGLTALPATAGAAGRPNLRGFRTVAAMPRLRGMERIGAVARSQEIAGAVAMNTRNPAVLKAYATAVSTPGTGLYHRFITTGRFADIVRPEQVVHRGCVRAAAR